jgi:hypothetical protein
MNGYYLLLLAIRILFLVLLFVIPFVFSVWKGNFKQCFWFSWIVWALVWFIFGFTLPAYAILVKKVTGEAQDVTCGTMFMGIMFGWLPSLILAPLGVFFHNLFIKKKSV